MCRDCSRSCCRSASASSAASVCAHSSRDLRTASLAMAICTAMARERASTLVASARWRLASNMSIGPRAGRGESATQVVQIPCHNGPAPERAGETVAVRWLVVLLVGLAVVGAIVVLAVYLRTRLPVRPTTAHP